MNIKILSLLALSTLAACVTPDTSNTQVSPPTATTSVSSEQSVLPTYQANTRAFLRTGEQAHEIVIARRAITAGNTTFTSAKWHKVDVDTLPMSFKKVRVDTFDFVVGKRAETIWRFAEQPSPSSILAAAEQLSGCTTNGEVRKFSAPSQSVYSLVPINC